MTEHCDICGLDKPTPHFLTAPGEDGVTYELVAHVCADCANAKTVYPLYLAYWRETRALSDMPVCTFEEWKYLTGLK